MISEPVLCRSFIGRAAELEHLLARRRAAAAGRGGTVLIAGEAGVGKSRLAVEFRASLPRRTTRVAAAACREFAQRPLGPWLDLLRALDREAAAALSARAFASKDEQMAALIDTFERLAARSTTIVLLEDLHWADPDILAVLLVLTERAAAQRMLFAGTYRDDEIVPGHPCFALIGRLLRERAVSLVKLGAFDEREMKQLVRGALPAEPVLPDETLRDVHRRADGNALFAEELLRHAVDRYRHGAGIVPEELPGSLHAIVRERLRQCAEGDRALLMRASLFGRTFELDLLAAAFELPPEQCREALERLAALQLVDASEAGTAEYRFRHALTRDVIYGEIPAEDLAHLHHRIASAILSRGSAEQHVEWLAHHYERAGELERAAPFCRAAGDAARAVHAYEDASAWYERAARAYGDAVASAGALVQAGLMHVFCDDVNGALARYERAAAAYEGAERFDDAIVARVMAASALHNGGHVEDSIAVLVDAERRLGARASRTVRERLLIRLGFAYAFDRRTDEAWAAALEAGQEALDDVSALAAEAHFLRSALHAQRAEPEPWRHHLDRGLELFAEVGALPDNVRAALGNGAQQALALGESSLAFAYQTRAFELARKLNVEVEREARALAAIELRRGRLEAARALLLAYPGPAKFSPRLQRTLVGLALALLCGDDDPAAHIDNALLDEAERGGHRAAAIELRTAYAAAHEFAGRAPEAERLLGRAAQAITTAYDMTVPIATIARLRPALAAPLRPLVERAAQRPADRVNRALLALLEAGSANVAAERFAALQWPVLAAQAYEIAGDPAAACRCYRTIGAHGEVRRLERALALRPDAARGETSLTPRERELIGVIADGRSNRAAALALSVSEKAVEKHLTSIYAKLGMTSRAQLAAYVAARRHE